MNKTKEKKISAIKSEILEIKDFVTSNMNDDNAEISDFKNKIDENSNHTLTLTKIIDSEKNEDDNDLIKIKKELSTIKSMIIKQEKILEEILTKIK